MTGGTERLRLGSRAVGRLAALFVVGGDGPMVAVLNDRDLLGNIGAEVLGKYRAAFDYTRARLALVPTS